MVFIKKKKKKYSLKGKKVFVLVPGCCNLPRDDGTGKTF